MACPRNGLVHEIGERETEHEAADRRTGGECQRAQHRPAETRIGQHLPEQIESDEIGFPPASRDRRSTGGTRSRAAAAIPASARTGTLRSAATAATSLKRRSRARRDTARGEAAAVVRQSEGLPRPFLTSAESGPARARPDGQGKAGFHPAARHAGTAIFGIAAL